MLPGLVSTIVPVFNRPVMLREAVASVLAQTYRPIEVIIVDDGSTDDTPVVADQLARDHAAEVRVIHTPNGGVGAARETGRLAARGAYIQYLDSDDLLYPCKFELQVAGLEAHRECGISYGPTRGRAPDGTLNDEAERRTDKVFASMFPAMLESRIWHTPTPLYRREITDVAGPWLRLVNEEDWEYDARIAAAGVRLHHTSEWVAEVRHHAGARLSGRGGDPVVLRDRTVAHEHILSHARRAGIATDAPEMQHFARELFLLSRQCGAAGLSRESARLFELARSASGDRADHVQFRAYRLAASIIGWSATGKLATMSDRVRWRRSP